MLEKFFHKKKEEKEYISALLVGDSRIDTAIWEVAKDGIAHVLKTAQAEFSGVWEEAIKAADKAITIVEESLPEGKELTKVVFGLYPHWVHEDHIKETELHKLKQLTKELALTPVGFVELPIAISHELHTAEGTQPTVVLVGFEVAQLTVSLFKIGKLIHTKTFARSDAVANDLEQVLTSFTDIEVLPSRVLLYGTIADLEQIKSSLLNHPWTKKAAFLHFPKIELLAPDYAVKAVAVASSAEIIPHTEDAEAAEVTATASVDETIDITKEPLAHETANVTAVRSKDVAKIAEDLFPTDTKSETVTHVPMDVEIEQEVAKAKEVLPETAVAAEVMATRTATVSEDVPLPSVGDTSDTPRSRFRFAIPKFQFAWPSFTFRIPQLKASRVGLVVGVGVLLFVIGGWYVWNWVLPSANVRILVSGKVFDQTENIKLDMSATEVDVDQKILPAKTATVEVTASDKVPATGKKTVGDKATGEITIYNKTQNEKIFKKGSALTSGSLKFTLSDDVSIASASEGVGSLTYGTQKAKVAAVQIGTASNVPPGTDFNFDGLPNTSYSGRNEQALSGGSSRDVAVVSRDDRDSLREKVLGALTTQAESEVQTKLSTSEKLLQNSIKTKVVSETFSPEIGEEASDVSLDMAVSASGFVYDEADFWQLLEKVATANLSGEYDYAKDNAKLAIEEVTDEDEEAPVVKARFSLELIPKVDIGGLAEQLAGKKSADVVSLLKERTGISGVEFQINWPFIAKPQNLPKNPNKISIEVAKL